MSTRPADATGGSWDRRPVWAWPIVMLVGVVVAVLALPYGIVDGARAIPAVSARAGVRVRRGWFVAALRCNEQWRRRHHMARRGRRLVEESGRTWRRGRKFGGKYAGKAVRTLRRGTGRAVSRALRTGARTACRLVGGVTRRLRGRQSEE